jgi:serine/threonine protein kinase
MILEFLKGGSLDVWLPENGAKLNGSLKLHVVHQVALGFVWLGQAAVIHRDLAARNVLIDEDLVAKVADYGLSRSVDDDHNYYRIQNDRALPLRWSAPEVILARIYTTASDVFSYGVLLFEVFSNGTFPYDAIPDDNDVIALLMDESPSARPIESHMPFPTPEPIHDAVRAIFGACVRRSSKDRPTFDVLVQQTSPAAELALPRARASARVPAHNGRALESTGAETAAQPWPGSAAPPRPNAAAPPQPNTAAPPQPAGDGRDRRGVNRNARKGSVYEGFGGVSGGGGSSSTDATSGGSGAASRTNEGEGSSGGASGASGAADDANPARRGVSRNARKGSLYDGFVGSSGGSGDSQYAREDGYLAIEDLSV